MIDPKNHFVVIPLAEYNELMAAKDFVGINEIDLKLPVNNFFRNAVSEQYKKTVGQYPTDDQLNRLKLYIKI